MSSNGARGDHPHMCDHSQEGVGPCPCYEQGVARGRRDEREAVATRLRSDAAHYRKLIANDGRDGKGRRYSIEDCERNAMSLESLAIFFERGDHLEATDADCCADAKIVPDLCPKCRASFKGWRDRKREASDAD